MNPDPDALWSTDKWTNPPELEPESDWPDWPSPNISEMSNKKYNYLDLQFIIGCLVVYWQYLQIHPSLLRSVRLVRSYPQCRRISTHLIYRFGSLIRKNYHHQKGIHYLRLGHLCPRRWFDRSWYFLLLLKIINYSPRYYFLAFGCYHCVVSSLDRIGYLPRRRSFGFYLQINGPPYYRRRPLWHRQKSPESLVRL